MNILVQVYVWICVIFGGGLLACGIIYGCLNAWWKLYRIVKGVPLLLNKVKELQLKGGG
ncbi:hypothetical protein LCGC14_1310380 [marine sediment metagenome]|uniref:Uncharacterized protein n=1 Tax=marine sediment metagenome TaxID=412755 RepID=A0A0F9N3S8_9ZZZZ